MTSTASLLRAAEAFVREAEASLTGAQAFQAKVAANALAIVARELKLRPAETEQEALAPWAGRATVAEQRRTLCAAIRNGRVGTGTPGLLAALTTATCANLSVDNPRYPTLFRLKGERPPARE